VVKDTFQSLNFIERSEGIRILIFLFPQKTLPIVVYNKANQFKETDFAIYTDESFVWNVIVKKCDKEGRVLTKHIFTKDVDKAKTFMSVNDNWAEKVFVRISPPRERIEYYGSILIDSKNFGNKIFISFSKINSADFVKQENGESFKILPRDLSSDIILEYQNKKLEDTGIKDIDKHLEDLYLDISKLRLFLKSTHRDKLTVPIMFVLDSIKGIQYVDMGFLDKI
jgi:hypothetical protein